MLFVYSQVPASQYGIKAPFEVDDDTFMAICLNGSHDKLNGIMEYDKAFGISVNADIEKGNVEDAASAFAEFRKRMRIT